MATVRLAPGQVAYYDPMTRIHLTLARPESGVPDSCDCSGLKRAHESGVIIFTETSPQVSRVAADAGTSCKDKCAAASSVVDDDKKATVTKSSKNAQAVAQDAGTDPAQEASSSDVKAKGKGTDNSAQAPLDKEVKIAQDVGATKSDSTDELPDHDKKDASNKEPKVSKTSASRSRK